MKKSGPSIASLMLFVFFVALFLTVSRSGNSPRVLVVIIVASLLSPFVLGPIKIHQTQWVAARPEFDAIEPDGPDLFPEADTALRATVPVLRTVGFVHRRTYRSSNLVPNSTGFVSLFQHERTKEVAKQITAINVTGSVRWVGSLLTFVTEYPDGTEILSSNTRVPRITPPMGPPIHGFVFPQVEDARSLLELHRALVERYGPPGLPRDPMATGPDEFLQRTEQRWVDHVRELGYYALDESGTVQRPTWKGAVLMTWRLLWPIKPIRAALRGWRAARLLRSLDLDRGVPMR